MALRSYVLTCDVSTLTTSLELTGIQYKWYRDGLLQFSIGVSLYSSSTRP